MYAPSPSGNDRGSSGGLSRRNPLHVRVPFAGYGIDWGTGRKVFGRPILQRHRGSRIALGDGVTLRSWPRSNPLAPTAPVVLSIRRAPSWRAIRPSSCVNCSPVGRPLRQRRRNELGGPAPRRDTRPLLLRKVSTPAAESSAFCQCDSVAPSTG